MNEGIEARLAHIECLQAAAGYAIRTPAPKEAIDSLALDLAREFGVELPQTLREFWSRRDGLWWDDYKLWRVVPAPGQDWPEDVLTQSRACRTDFGINHIALGGSSTALYGLDCDAGQWTVGSKDGEDMYEAFPLEDFDAYLERLLQIIANDPPAAELELMRQTYGREP